MTHDPRKVGTSLLLTRVRKQAGAIVSAHVGGRCFQMMEGTFQLAGEG
jgi:trans-2,3-dihydro-3-hydroxyanthranilate isomerase